MPTQESLAGQQHDIVHIDEEWLQFERDVLKTRPLISGTVEQIRAAYAATSDDLGKAYPPPSDYAVREFTLTTDKGIALRVYAPTAASSQGPRPVGVFTHGGGNVAGGVWASTFEDRMCRFIVDKTGAILVHYEFRRAPEHPAPAQVEDGYDAFLWCYANADKLGGEVSKFFCIGSSLGAGIALGTSMMLIDNGHADKNRGVVAICPAAMHPRHVPDEFKPIYKAYDQTWTGVPMQDGDSMILFYALNGYTSNQTNPYVMPCIHPGLKHLPPTYLLACGCDPVRDDARVVYEVLSKEKKKTHFSCWNGMPHFFWIFPLLSKAIPFHEDVVSGVHWVLKNMEYIAM